MAFCGPCAREQEAYFAIGEIVARGEARGPRGRALAEALERLRRESAGAGGPGAEQVEPLIRQAFADATNASFLVGAAALVVGAALALVW